MIQLFSFAHFIVLRYEDFLRKMRCNYDQESTVGIRVVSFAKVMKRSSVAATLLVISVS